MRSPGKCLVSALRSFFLDGAKRPFFLLALGLVLGICQVQGQPVISEFMAANQAGLKDEDGEFSDWIEIANPGSTPANLEGYFLTDRSTDLLKWKFPAVTVKAGGYLVVFASGKNRNTAGAPLHTSFKLASEGGYLALAGKDGTTVVSSFAPAYPPQFEDVSFGRDNAGTLSYFTAPTPGAANGAGTRAGPEVRAVDPNPAQPNGGPLVIEALVRPVNAAVAGVRLYFRKMFAAEAFVEMTDDGVGADFAAGDGIWSAEVPAQAFAPGEMTRWRFVARDAGGTETKEPAFRAALDSHQYFGTVTADPRIQSRLSVLHWFTANPGGAATTTGSRGALYYNGEFYDNVLFTLHGQSSAGFPKKSYNIDFNRTQHFRWSPNAPRVADIDLLTNWADKSKVRNVLGYEVMRRSGVATHFAFTLRVQQNGNFFSTADFVEDADEIYLSRAGLNPDGALYKVYGNVLNKSAGNTATTGVEKKTRKFEGNSDLQGLIDGLALTGSALTNYLYDNIDIPACVNMLAANSVIRNIDMHSKNWYIYRDTGRSGEWSILPWDLDLSHGRVWNTQNTYFDNGMYTDGYVVTGDAIRLVAQMFGSPQMRSMIMRRIRTLTDEFLQPPSGVATNDLYYERRLDEQSALIDPPDIVPSDARRDFEKWGSWLHGGTVVSYTNTNAAVETMAEAIERWKIEYLPARRKYIYNTQVAGKGGEIPLPQTGAPVYVYTPLVAISAPALAFVPTNSNLGLTWIGTPTTEPFDATGWISGKSGIGYERGTDYRALIGLDVGGAMQTNTSVYIRLEFNVDDPATFDRLELRMKFDDAFVAFLNGAILASGNAPAGLKWNSAAPAKHNADPNAFDVYDVSSKKGNLLPGRNVLAIQGFNDSVSSPHMLIVPELYAGKPGPGTAPEPVITFGTIESNPISGNQEEEYIQVRNTNRIAVDISRWQVTGAIEHTFSPGTVLPANGTLYLCPSAASFRARKTSPKGGEGLFVQGGYRGHLSNEGESLTLLTASGITNSTGTYVAQVSEAQRYLAISEIMYHPPGDGLAEFVELLNTSDSVTLDLAHVRLTKGVEFDFSNGTVATLPPHGRVLVVRDLAAFTAVYGQNLPVAGLFANGSALSNGGESIKLEDSSNSTIQEFAYSDVSPWPPGADGQGYSIVLASPGSHPDPTVASHWRTSAKIGGSPGGDDLVQFPKEPAGDADHNGTPDIIDYALGNNLGLSTLSPGVLIAAGSTESPRFTYPISLGAEAVQIHVRASSDLQTWEEASAYLGAPFVQLLGDGRALVSYTLGPSTDRRQLFLRLEIVPR